MTCKDIVKKFLEDNGYDGLYNLEGDSCACLLTDFMPCGGEMAMDCQPGYRSDGCTNDCGMGCDFHIGEKQGSQS